MVLTFQILLIGSIVFSNSSLSKSDTKEIFEGKVVYAHTYEPDSLAYYYGSESIFYFKNGNYKQVFNGEKVKASTYNRNDNLIHTIINNDTVIVDAGEKSEKIESYKIRGSRTSVLGEKCDLLMIETSRRKASYFYSKKYPIDPEMLQEHKYSGLAFIYSQMKSIPLKIRAQYSGFTVTMTAVKIERVRLTDEIFNIDR